MAGLGCVRALVIAFNVIFFLIGLIIIGLGSWFVADSKSLLGLLEDFNVDVSDFGSFNTLIIGIGAGVIVVGFVMSFTAILGWCGASKENKCLLGTFFGILFVLFCACVACGVLALQQDVVKSAISDIMEFEIGKQNWDGLYGFSHNEYACCGYRDESICSQDYGPVNSTTGVDACPKESTLCSKNCVDELWDALLNSASMALGVTLLVICAVQLFGMFMSLCLCCGINKRSSDRFNQHYTYYG